MKITESELKRIIKEEVVKEIGLSTLASANDKIQAMPGMGNVSTDTEVLTVDELREYLGGLGEKGIKYVQALDKIMAFVERMNDRNDNISSEANKRGSAAEKSMFMKVAGMARPDRWKSGDQWEQLDSEFWDKFGAAAGKDEYDYLSPDEAQQKFNLTDDEKTAYARFTH